MPKDLKITVAAIALLMIACVLPRVIGPTPNLYMFSSCLAVVAALMAISSVYILVCTEQDKLYQRFAPLPSAQDGV